MRFEETQSQSDDDKRQARDLSEQSISPPVDVPGYEIREFLGAGAFGQVWVAVDKNTGRRVAIKFYSHRNALDWPLLSREVEKLVFLSADRYVVQLLDVGWDAEPPYYVMEFIENGSLDDYLHTHGTMSVAEATELFHEIAIGLSHAHSKGVLHCDLKPANILLDQDRRPRLADFGQSRLTYEQTPALGTLFYMAPEQADLQAVPDARWDVYALGALLYRMLTGSAPHRTPAFLERIEQLSGLSDRLECYQRLIHSAPLPDEHRSVPGMDRGLAEILDRCLAAHPADRFPHVANVLEALDERKQSRARRPLILLGLVGPLVLLATMALFGFRAYDLAVNESEELLRRGAANTNRFAVAGEARNVAHGVEMRFRAVEAAAEDPELARLLTKLLTTDVTLRMLDKLADPRPEAAALETERAAFVDHEIRIALQDYFEILVHDPRQPRVASWILTGPRGTMLAAAFAEEGEIESPVGKCYAYRTYYHGGPRDLQPHERPTTPIAETHISTVFRSTATGTSKVAMTTPVRAGRETVAVVGITVEIGDFVEFPTSPNQCALLVDARSGDKPGVVLQHPLFEAMLRRGERLPNRFDDPQHRVDVQQLMAEPQQGPQSRGAIYLDPMGNDPLGSDYAGEWIACAAPVTFERQRAETNDTYVHDTGLLMIVQERATTATEPVDRLARRLWREGLAALIAFMVVTPTLWLIVLRIMRAPRKRNHFGNDHAELEGSTMHSRETIELPFPDRR